MARSMGGWHQFHSIEQGHANCRNPLCLAAQPPEM